VLKREQRLKKTSQQIFRRAYGRLQKMKYMEREKSMRIKGEGVLGKAQREAEKKT